MDINKILADMRKQICCLQEQLGIDGFSNSAWYTVGNLSISEDSFLGSINEADVIFKTFDLERARITKGGLFGIGTNSPSVTLDVNGQIRLRGGNPGVGKILESDANGVGTWVTPSSFILSGNNGVSISGGIVVLGQDVGALGNPAGLLSNREIPLNGRFIQHTSTIGQIWRINPNGSISYTDTTDTNSAVYTVNITRTGAGRFQFTNSATTNASVLYQAINNLGDITSFGTNSTIFTSGNEPPSVGKLVTSATNGLWFNSISPTGVIAFATSGQGLGFIKGIITSEGNFILGNTNTLTPTNNGSKLQVVSNLNASEAASGISLTQTWNTTGIPTAIKANIVDTASDATSLLMDIQLGGISRFKVSKTITDIAGQIAVRGGSPGVGKVLTSDGSGLATWETLGGAGLLTDANTGLSLNGSIVQLGQVFGEVGDPALINTLRQIPMTTGSGSIMMTSPTNAAFAQTFTANSHSIQATSIASPSFQILVSDLGELLAINWNNTDTRFRLASTTEVELSSSLVTLTGQIKIEGGVPGVGKILTSDVNGLATWENPTPTGDEIEFTAGEVGFPAVGATTYISSGIVNRKVLVVRNGLVQRGSDPGDGNTYITKVLGSNTITFSHALIATDFIQIIVI